MGIEEGEDSMSSLSRYGKYSPGMYGLPHMGEVIADYRIKQGWASQDAFATVCGVDKQTVVYWENSRYLADMDRRIFLAKVLKIPPALLGLTWRSVIDENKTDQYTEAIEHITELFAENTYALYEDILSFAYSNADKYSPTAAYRFQKHQQELEAIVERTPEIEKGSWKELLSRYYQLSTFIAQHHGKDAQALSYANRAVDLAFSLDDTELQSASLYRRSRVHLIQIRHDQAKQDVQSALEKAERARGPLKGSCYLLAAEVNSLYVGEDEGLKAQCRKWQDKAANLIYKGKVEDDGTFLLFNLYAVHHERAKTLLRFALPHTTDDELVTGLKNPHARANARLLKDAQDALTLATSQFGADEPGTDLTLTEARLYLLAREFEESAKTAKRALNLARKKHSVRNVGEVRTLYTMLNELAPVNPYVRNLGIELEIY